MDQPKLFMILLGCTPPGRYTEQHDVFFSIADSLPLLKQEMIDFWPEASGKIHIDGWRQVSSVNGYKIQILPATQEIVDKETMKLFFINLGGYKENEFDEFHYKTLIPAKDKGDAIQLAKKSAFYKHTGFKGAESHIDDKYGIDVDDAYNIEEILPKAIKEKYKINLVKDDSAAEDKMHLGYLKLNKI